MHGTTPVRRSMPRSAIIFVCLWISASVASRAAAGTLATPSMFSGTGINAAACEGVNVGSKPLKLVTVTFVPAYLGGPSATNTCVDLAPGSVCQAYISIPPFFSGHCRIDFKGGRKSIRGALSVIDTGNHIAAALPAT